MAGGEAARLREEARAMLAERLVPFWSSLADEAHGGFYGQVGFDLSPMKTAPKGSILNSRILWFFSSAILALNRPELLHPARHAFRFLTEYCMDREHGGVYWAVNYNGAPMDTTKHTYAQAFAVYGLAAWYRASGEEAALTMAQELYHLMESRCADALGYGEAYDRAFSPVDNGNLSENGVHAARTMNTLLHVFEAYAGLYQAMPDAEVANSMHRILGLFEKKIYNPGLERQEVFFDAEMNSLIDLQSYGHDIEAAWLLDWGAGLLGNTALSRRVDAITGTLVQSVYRRAYRGHSVRNERENGVEDEARVWWVQAEAIVGFLNEWQKRPRQVQFLEAALDIWDFVKKYLADPRCRGEWFWQVDAQGYPCPEKPIASPWKCPYHNGRMCIEIMRRCADAAP